jgi:Xaa-Pro aminopeptidase
MAKDERILNPVSMAELERRWKAVRAAMREARLDALVVQGFANIVGLGGYYRWFTGVNAANAKSQSVLFPIEGLMTLVKHGGFEEQKSYDGANALYPGVGRLFTTPNFCSVSYTCDAEADLLAGAIKAGGHRAVGLVGLNNMMFGFGQRLEKAAEGVVFTDATELVDPIRAVKSAEEIELIRRGAAMQDDIMEKIRGFIRPGMRDFEVMAHGEYLGALQQSEGGYITGSSAPPGDLSSIRHRSHQGRTIREGDVLYYHIENMGPGGLFTHLGRFFSLGRPSQEMVDAFGAMLEAQDFTMARLKPGVSSSELFAEYNAYLRGRGLPEERRIHCHGQGYDVVERPLVRNDESMKIGADMSIGSHPAFSTRTLYMTVCDNFLTRADGSVERMHRTPLEIFEL